MSNQVQFADSRMEPGAKISIKSFSGGEVHAAG